VNFSNTFAAAYPEDRRLDLDLPLVGDRLRPRADVVEEGLRRRRVLELAPIGPVIGEAVAALCRADDGSSRLHDLRGRGHPLDGLVEVLIEGEARVRREDDVERLGDQPHRGSLRRRARSAVGGVQVAAVCTDEPLLGVDDHVEREVRPRTASNASSAASSWAGTITVVRSCGSSTSSPRSPYASSILTRRCPPAGV
jgi:hypothetical protein